MPGRTVMVVGVGPPKGLGAAIAWRFAREDFRVTEVVVGDVTHEAL